VVFIGIGFETTAPTIAASILQAEQEKLKNYYVLSLHKVCPPIMKAILDLGEVRLDGIICPGHVSAIIGSLPYRCLAEDYGIACAVSGFEPLDILLAVDRLVEQIEGGQPKVEIAYRRGVRPEGNLPALRLMDNVFEASDANWRGIGVVPASGLSLRPEYEKFDAGKHFKIDPGPTSEPRGCICGSILRGVSSPRDCRLFRETCTPEHPVGPCMVSSEGSCATYYHYEGMNR
jgi:hydrogenase expression/formation protein HypD